MDDTNVEKLKLWLIKVISAIVVDPSALEIAITSDEMGILYVVKTIKEDQGKVIGKQGATAMALRTLLRAAGSMSGVRASLKIDSGSRYEAPRSEV